MMYIFRDFGSEWYNNEVHSVEMMKAWPGVDGGSMCHCAFIRKNVELNQLSAAECK